MEKRVMCGLVLVMCSGVMAAPRANITIRVVDETGTPVEGASTSINFEMYPDQVKSFKGLTDTNGLFSAQEETDTNVSEVAEKDGYYKSSETHFFKALSSDQTRYEPWDEVRTLVLRKIIDPKEGKKRGIGGAIPKLDEAIGADLMIGDWVAPFGKGVVSDLVFTCSNDTTNKVAFFVMSFPNAGDGIIEFPRNKKGQSIFWWPHQAPLDGYLNKMMKKQSYSGGTPVPMQDYEELPRESLDVQCIFRIRTKYDANGEIVSAYYGKIKGVPGITWNNRVGFGYWLNTDRHSRSLESTDPYSP